MEGWGTVGVYLNINEKREQLPALGKPSSTAGMSVCIMRPAGLIFADKEERWPPLEEKRGATLKTYQGTGWGHGEWGTTLAAAVRMAPTVPGPQERAS